MTLFQWMFGPPCALIAVWFLIRALRGGIPRAQASFWMLLWGAAACLIVYPDGISALSSWLGIGRGADLISYLAILAGLAACVYFYNRYRRLEIVVTSVIRQQAIERARFGAGDSRFEKGGADPLQEIALLKHRLADLETAARQPTPCAQSQPDM
ncbi:MAG: DUF2304 family protein [Pirellulaceae bacterium]|nr:DUF2304 family protein [Pirellulaceae bacterium]